MFLDRGTYDVAVGGSTATSAGRFTLHMQHIPVSINGTNFIAAPLGTSGDDSASSTLPAMSLARAGRAHRRGLPGRTSGGSCTGARARR